jgi:hypothetical protein
MSLLYRPLYNVQSLLIILEGVAYGYHSSINHPLIVEGANASLLKWSAYYDKSSPIVMAVNFMNPRLKMEYFLENGWKLLLMLGKC